MKTICFRGRGQTEEEARGALAEREKPMPKRKPPPPGLLQYPEAANYLGISVKTLSRLARRRQIRCLRPSRFVVQFRQVDLEKYLSSTANKQIV